MISNIPEELPIEVIGMIKEFINENMKDYSFPDKPIGSEIFNIIENNNCIVVFYPIIDEDEANDAFLISRMPMSNGKMVNIVVINTYQTVEKQVFAAAHELGHLLSVSEYVNKKLGETIDIELIVNRFAAELLMPEELFRGYMTDQLRKYDSDNDHMIKLDDIIRIIINAMLEYTVPYNSVVIRLREVGLITRKIEELLVDGNELIPQKVIQRIIDSIKSENEYIQIQAISMKREIKGLKDILDKAENTAISKEKIDRLRNACVRLLIVEFFYLMIREVFYLNRL